MIPSDVDEALDAGPVADAVESLALRKGRAVASRIGAGMVLAADTVVVIDGLVLGKPAGPEEARGMLERLRGRPHEVMTGIAVIEPRTGRVAMATEVTRVVMARYPDDLIDRYVRSGAPFDKAGGYAIQDFDGALVDLVDGSYTNVIGLPLALTARLLASAGLGLSGWSSS